MRGLLIAVTLGVLGLVFLVATRAEWEGASYLLALLLLVLGPTVMAVLFLAAVWACRWARGKREAP